MPGEPGSRMDQQFCADINRIADCLNRLANCAEADEKRKRREEDLSVNAHVSDEYSLEGQCVFGDDEPVVMILNGKRFCRRHIDEAFISLRPAMDAVQRGMADLEKEAGSDR